ncbi:alpha-L-rhamnosidase [Streptococcus moroccensis]|uniref:alpha-L-rhamnosidase n=1 Tax=Streptococcus moroccensis TaxID=1451356 RepID=A0ABT9YPB9_9STRE|nr:alpha-L-rhamnosidase [Streptococcus moroccensis]MDQ0221828.1 alpha-L-rhamnosidase [Streptococcus moroccensis]
MDIKRLKINGIVEPLGFHFDDIIVSWTVENSTGTHSHSECILVALDSEFKNIIFESEQGLLDSSGVSIPITLAPRTRYYVKVLVEDDMGDKAEKITFFETGKRDEDWQGQWITTSQDDEFHPLFSKSFISEKTVKKARLYICGLGLYEAYLGAEKIGNEYLTPNLNDYQSALQVQTYDVTHLIKRENTFSVLLGNGWYKGKYGDENSVPYGAQFGLVAELHIKSTDGEVCVITTDQSWTYIPSNVEQSGIYFGESYNRILWENHDNMPKSAQLMTMSVPLIDRYSLPVVVKETLAVKELIVSPKGETILDFGQNFTGWVEWDNCLPKGTRVQLEFGEILQDGNFYNDNYRTAESVFIYTSNGEKERVRPHFTFFGFRYVKVTGWVGTLDTSMFRGSVVYSDLERTGFIQTGHEKINRLYQNSLWGMKSNFLDLPTDCPQRDERLGWTGDAQVFSKTASYHMDTRAFYHKYLWDMRLEQQKRHGGVPAFIPVPPNSNLAFETAIWGDAATFIPNTLKEFYGVSQYSEIYYKQMKDWVDFVARRLEDVKGTKVALWDFSFQFGDWLALDGPNEQSFKGDTPDDYLATMYFCRSLEIVALFGEALGKAESKTYRSYYEELRQFLLDTYFTPVGHLSSGTQSSYIVALNFNIYRNRAVLIDDFTKLLQKHQNSIKCGFVGAPLICQTLAECGRHDLAYQLLFKETYPSWLYAVNLGATTIWERWNSVLPDGHMSGTGMNSLNHYSYGNVVEFLYRYAAGLAPKEAGFKTVKISPKLNGKLKFCDCQFDSAYGRYRVKWEILENRQVTYDLQIPFNCQAEVELEGCEEVMVLETGNYHFQFETKSDYTQRYHEDSTLGEIFENSAATEIFKKIVPVYELMADNGAMRINQLRELVMLGLSQETEKELLRELKHFKY